MGRASWFCVVKVPITIPYGPSFLLFVGLHKPGLCYFRNNTLREVERPLTMVILHHRRGCCPMRFL